MAAIKQVRTNFIAALSSLTEPVLEERDERAPIRPSEAPCYVVAERGATIGELNINENSGMQHTGIILLAAVTPGSASETGRDRALDMLTAAINLLMQDPTLGGTVQEVRLVDYGGEDQLGTDIAAVPATFEVDFWTTDEDLTTLIY